jgi:hypothetical protein
MSFSFSEEGMFFIQNWGIIEKLSNSLQNFRSEFSNYLYSVENIVKTKNWWSDEELVFKKRDQKQVYISKKGWSDDNIEYYIWIGIENFVPESLLGTSDPANCYLWVTGSKANVILRDLSTIFKDKEEFSDYFTNKGGYILKKLLRKYTEEEFQDRVPLQEIVEFMGKVYLNIYDYKMKI